jgi:hypothetical protein
MGSSWSGFSPQNDIVKLQWAVLEGCQTEVAARFLSALLETVDVTAARQIMGELDDGAWNPADFGFREVKTK